MLCLGIGVCMLNYVVKFKCGILCSGREGYCVAQHILHNRHEYGPIDHTMTILKPLKDATLLTPYEEYFIQTLHQEDQLIPEQFAGGKNPLLHFAIDPAYTQLEETSQVSPVLQYTYCNATAHRLPTHHNNRYVPFPYD